MAKHKQVARKIKLFYAMQKKSGALTASQAASTNLLSLSTAWRAVKEFEATGDIQDHRPISGRPSKATAGTKAWIVAMVRHRPAIMLDELRLMLLRYLGISVNTSTMSRWLKGAGISVKKLSRIARQRDEERRAAFALKMARYHPSQLVFADETHFNNRTGLRNYGWAQVVQRAATQDDFNRGGRWALLPALGVDGLLAPYIVEGSITQDRFAFWVEHFLLSRMSAFPGPQSILVVDNASVHKDQYIKDLLAAHVFLPPYSPDFNPIELAFASIKSRLRRQESTTAMSVLRACDQVRDAHGRAYFRSCGYGLP